VDICLSRAVTGVGRSAADREALPAAARRVVDDLLARLERAVPGRIDGFYVVGSACMGAFRLGRSDLDFVALVSSELGREGLTRIRAAHLAQWKSSLIRDLALRWHWPLVCNGIYLVGSDLRRSPLQVTPVAGHVAGRFRVAERSGLDVNPVTWQTLARHSISIRGPTPAELQVRLDDAELRAWTHDNLNRYWRRWSERSRRSALTTAGALPRRTAARGVLGAPRLHYTLATGAIATKEAAGHYALEVFEPSWHPLIADALGYWRGARARGPYRRHPARRQRDAAEFVACVIEDANQRWSGSPHGRLLDIVHRWPPS